MNDNKLKQDKIILERIKENLDNFKDLLKHEFNEDIPYRFYHQSFKVYYSQGAIKAAKELFEIIAGQEFTINKWWLQIASEALEMADFNLTHNKVWLEKTRPQMEAFFHTKYFIEMMVKYGEELEDVANMLPSGWAAVLYLFNSR